MSAGPRISEWRKVPLSLTELCIDTTLRCGQAFRWRKVEDEWHCALQGRIVSLKQDPDHLHYRATLPKRTAPLALPSPPFSNSTTPLPHTQRRADFLSQEDDIIALLTSYFNLRLSLSSLYATWSKSDPNFARRASSFTGIRILNQDAWEALVAFICSSNNNISRINQMVSKLCTHYGPYLGTVAGQAFHDFPSPAALAADGVETRLRELGFGYRAKYIADTARTIAMEKPVDWLIGLRNPLSPALGQDGSLLGTPSHVEMLGADPKDNQEAILLEGGGLTGYKAAHEALLSLAGVGPKVADCVCLMGLGWAEAVPVDTHVWQIAQRDYKFGGSSRTKTFNKSLHDAVGDHFRTIWGPYAGWAQSVLFTANLKSFAEQATSGRETETVKVEDRKVKIEKTEEILTTHDTSRVKSRKRKTVIAETVIKKQGGQGLAPEGRVISPRRSKRLKS